jgi:hypothetical protein
MHGTINSPHTSAQLSQTLIAVKMKKSKRAAMGRYNTQISILKK